MKTARLMLALLLAGLIAASCAGPRKLKMENSGDIPAAEATVAIGTNDNGNTTFDLAVRHLALPSRVDPKANTYVVWLRGGDSSARTQNMGALKVDSDLNGSYSGVTPLRDFDLFVTVEPSPTATTPTGKSLLYRAVTAK